MDSQLSFLPPNQLDAKPEHGRSEPRLWVRRLVLWENPETVIREIRLRPGLNVIWSPDAADQSRKRGTAHGLGHGSGKTLFCRLLRYCLGEDRFADDNQRRRIATALKDGLVGVDVNVDGVPWSVLRPLGTRHKHYAVPNVELESLVSGDHQATGIDPFVEAVETTLLTKPVAALIARGDHSMAWLLSLAWLSRDQECRFDHVLDWRSAASDSDSPARDLAKALHLAALRALIGAVVPAEFELQEEFNSDVNGRKRHERVSEHRQWEMGEPRRDS